MFLQSSDRGGDGARIIAEGRLQITSLDESGDQLLRGRLVGRPNNFGHGCPKTANRAASSHDGKYMRTDRSLVRDERHYLMDKKNDHSCKHSQRDSFIDTCAARYCYAFHSFPHPDDSAKSPYAVTLNCFGERGVNCKPASPDTVISEKQ